MASARNGCPNHRVRSKVCQATFRAWFQAVLAIGHFRAVWRSRVCTRRTGPAARWWRSRPAGAPGRPRPARRKASGQTLPVGAALVAASRRSRPVHAGHAAQDAPGLTRLHDQACGAYPLGAGAGPADVADGADGAAVLAVLAMLGGTSRHQGRQAGRLSACPRLPGSPGLGTNCPGVRGESRQRGGGYPHSRIFGQKPRRARRSAASNRASRKLAGTAGVCGAAGTAGTCWDSSSIQRVTMRCRRGTL